MTSGVLNKAAEGPERHEYLKLGDRIYDLIPKHEKLANVGKRIAIDLKSGEYRFYDGSLPREALPVVGPTWTSIVHTPVDPLFRWH